MQREKTGKISFYKKPDEDVTGYEAASSEQEDMIAEYIMSFLRMRSRMRYLIKTRLRHMLRHAYIFFLKRLPSGMGLTEFQ